MARARLHRYRTDILLGPWRLTRQAALDDAVFAGQATRFGAEDGDVVWRVPGEIETWRP